MRPKRLFMLLYCFLLIKAVILVETVPKDDNKPFHTFFLSIDLYILIHPEFSGGRKIYEMTYFLGCYPIVPYTPTVGTIMVILYSSVIFWCSAIKDIVWGHGWMAVKLYIPSTINIRGKLLITAIWAEKMVWFQYSAMINRGCLLVFKRQARGF